MGLTHPKGHVKGIPVAGIYPYENASSQYTLSGDYSVALLLLQKPIAFGKHITRMAFAPKKSWDSCKVMGLQMLQPGMPGMLCGRGGRGRALLGWVALLQNHYTQHCYYFFSHFKNPFVNTTPLCNLACVRQAANLEMTEQFQPPPKKKYCVV